MTEKRNLRQRRHQKGGHHKDGPASSAEGNNVTKKKLKTFDQHGRLATDCRDRKEDLVKSAGITTEFALLVLMIFSFLLFMSALWTHVVVVGDTDAGFVSDALLGGASFSSVWAGIESWWFFPAMDAAIIYRLKNDDFESHSTVNQEQRKEKAKQLVSETIRRAFVQDGVVAIRGLFSLKVLNRLEAAADELIAKKKLTAASQPQSGGGGSQFYLTKMGAIYLQPPLDNSSDHETERSLSAFRKVALESAIPQIAAELLDIRHDQQQQPRIPRQQPLNVINSSDNSNDSNTTLHILRDVFLAKNEDEYICGWHVDDVGFWPATAESPGVNAWIALDDMPSAHGGGFALAVGSHKASWRQDAYRATGATPTLPDRGFSSAADLFANRTGAGTCNLKTAAPHLHQAMERRKRIYDIRKGDVIFHTRWLFHRTVPFDRDYVRQQQQQKQHWEAQDSLLYRRYSIRYAPGTARLPQGYGTEPSILWNPDNAGKPLTQVDGPWYPQCWPHVRDDEMEALSSLVHDMMPVAEARLRKRQAEMKPYLRQMAAAQQQNSKHGRH